MVATNGKRYSKRLGSRSMGHKTSIVRRSTWLAPVRFASQPDTKLTVHDNSCMLVGSRPKAHGDAAVYHERGIVRPCDICDLCVWRKPNYFGTFAKRISLPTQHKLQSGSISGADTITRRPQRMHQPDQLPVPSRHQGDPPDDSFYSSS